MVGRQASVAGRLASLAFVFLGTPTSGAKPADGTARGSPPESRAADHPEGGISHQPSTLRLSANQWVAGGLAVLGLTGGTIAYLRHKNAGDEIDQLCDALLEIDAGATLDSAVMTARATAILVFSFLVLPACKGSLNRGHGGDASMDVGIDGPRTTDSGADSNDARPADATAPDGGLEGGASGNGGVQGTGGMGGGDVSSGSGGTVGTGASGGGAGAGDQGGRAGAAACGSAGTCANGAPCSSGSQCVSGFCVDGVCCDGQCDGNCESCSTGTCSFSSTPRKPCDGSGKCGGSCVKDNTKSCTYPGSSTTCSDQSCAAGTRTNKAVCDGKGTCPAATTTKCDSNMCNGTDCSGSCTATSCGAGLYCAGTTCAPVKTQGNSCLSDTECSTGHCVDGYCCESACTGTCTICSATPGKCTNTKTARAGKSCGGTGTCAGSCGGSSPDCTLPGSTTVCGQPSCTSGTYKPAGTCNAGSCTTPASQVCPFVCSTSAGCIGSCKPGTSAPQCSATGVPQTCGSDGTWQNQPACTGGKTCSGGTCACSGSTPKDCNGTCIASGACCGNADCSGGKTCNTSTHQCACSGSTPKDCSGTCYASSSCCSDSECTTGGKTSCNTTSHQCACPLNGPVSSCGNCLSWDFSNGVQGWQFLDTGTLTSGTGQTLSAENGRLVLRNPNPDLSQRFSASLVVWLCGDHSLPNVNGYTVTAKVEILNTMNNISPENVIRLVGNNGKFVNIKEEYSPPGFTWFTISGTLTANSSIIGILMDFGDVPMADKSILIEEVTLTPP